MTSHVILRCQKSDFFNKTKSKVDKSLFFFFFFAKDFIFSWALAAGQKEPTGLHKVKSNHL